jgi:hypothetical protein
MAQARPVEREFSGESRPAMTKNDLFKEGMEFF